MKLRQCLYQPYQSLVVICLILRSTRKPEENTASAAIDAEQCL